MDTGTTIMGIVLVTITVRTFMATVDMEKMGSETTIKRRSKIGDATTAEAGEILSRYP